MSSVRCILVCGKRRRVNELDHTEAGLATAIGPADAEPGVLVVGADHRVAYANDRFREIHVVPRHLELVGHDFTELGCNLAKHLRRLRIVDNAEALVRVCFTGPIGDGPETMTFESGQMKIVAEATPMPGGGFVMLHRVVEDREKLRRIDAIERRFSDVMEAFADWYWETGPDHRFIYVGNPINSHTLLRADEYIGVRRWEMPGILEAPDSEFWQNHRAVLARHEAFRDVRYARRLEDGSLSHFSIDGKPVFNRAGEFVGYRGVGREISHLANMERRVAESEQRFRNLVEGSIQGLLVHVDGKIVFANPAAARILGFESCNDMLELDSVSELFWPDERPRLEEYRKARLRGDPAPEDYELRAKRRDGRMIWVENRARVVQWEGQQAVQASIYDITQRKKARLKMEESRKRLAGILDIAPEAIMSVDESNRVRIFNKGAQKLFGYSESEMLGQPVERLMPERYRARHADHIAAFARSETVSRPMSLRGEIVGRKRDGSEFPAEASISKLKTEGGWLFNVTIQDVTERKRARAELVEAREAAEAANRAKSEFLWNMSHELRTPLNAIIGFSELIRDEIFGPIGQDRYMDYARDIHASGAHLLSLIDDILDLSRIEAGIVEMREEPLRLDEELESAARMLEPRAARERKLLKVHCPDGLPQVLADAKMMRQILINLITNAVKYSETGGHVDVAAELTADGAITVSIADDGPGIAASEMERVFQPFARSSQVAARDTDGYGLGLPMARKFCNLHQITLEMISGEGEGTTARLEIPSYRVL